MFKTTALIAVLAAATLAGPALAQVDVQFGFGREAPGTFWYRAPVNLHDRIGWLDIRMSRMRKSGRLSAQEFASDHRQLLNIRSDLDRLAWRTGGHLSPRDRAMIWSRLEGVSNRLHWQATDGY